MGAAMSGRRFSGIGGDTGGPARHNGVKPLTGPRTAQKRLDDAHGECARRDKIREAHFAASKAYNANRSPRVMTDERRARAAREAYAGPSTCVPGEDADVSTGALRAFVGCAVPLWIERLRHRTFAEIQHRAAECADAVAAMGDVLMFNRGQRHGETAKAFNRFAEAVACMSFASGGVTVFGLHFETPHEEPR
jgi:hypothetical protein